MTRVQSRQINNLTGRISRVLDIQESVDKRVNSIILKNEIELKKILERIENTPEEEYFESLNPFLKGIYGYVRQGSFGVREVRNYTSMCSKVLLLGEVIEEEFNNLKKFEGKYANIRIIPYYGEYDYKPETKIMEVKINQVKELDESSGRPRVYFEENNVTFNESLMEILFAKRESQDTDGGLYRIKILGEDTEFPSKKLVESIRNLEWVLYRFRREL